MIRGFREKYNLLVVLGPTASGKTGLAVRLARRMGGEIISADSRQVYRGMDLGTGKDLSDYSRGGIPVPYHLIDIINPSDEFSLFDYQKNFFECHRMITAMGKIPIMAGGTGLYIDSVIRGYRMPLVPENKNLRKELEGEEMESLCRRYLSLRPDAHNTTDLRERNRLIRALEITQYILENSVKTDLYIRMSPMVLGIRFERTALRKRITDRLKSRLENGMIEEVRRLHKDGIDWRRIDAFGLEYRYAGLYLRGDINYQQMFEILNTRIHQYAKRQETWFRGMEKKGVSIRWIEGADEDAAVALIEKASL